MLQEQLMNRYEKEFFKNTKKWLFPWIAIVLAFSTAIVLILSWYSGFVGIFFMYLAAIVIALLGVLFQISANTYTKIQDQDHVFKILKGD